MGATCAWKTPRGWTGRRFRLGTNKKVFGTEVHAIYRTLSIIDRKQEGGHRYTVFVDSTSAIDLIRSDAPGPEQRLAAASIEVCTRITAKNNQVTIRWVPAHQGAEGNEKGTNSQSRRPRAGTRMAPFLTNTSGRLVRHK